MFKTDRLHNLFLTLLRKPKLAFLVVWWLCAISIVVLCSTDYRFNQVRKNEAENAGALVPRKNEIGAFAVWRWDPETNHRPVYSVTFENLCTENAHLGIFKTALHKVVKIEDLQAKFFQYSTNGRFGSAQALLVTIFSSLLAPEDNRNDEMILDEILAKFKDRKRGWSFSIDLSNVSEIRIKNLDYKIFNNGVLLLGVRCKRARVSCKSPEIILRGHATITTANGSTLESNCIKWNAEKQRFTAYGGYVLNRDGMKITGKGICLDAQLNTVQAQSAKS